MVSSIYSGIVPPIEYIVEAAMGPALPVRRADCRCARAGHERNFTEAPEFLLETKLCLLHECDINNDARARDGP